MQDIRSVIAVPAGVTDTNRHVLKENKSILVLEALDRQLLGPDCSFAVLALISVHRNVSGHVIS